MGNLYEEYRRRMCAAVRKMNDAAEIKDRDLNRINYGIATTYQDELYDIFGSVVDLRVYSNSGYLVTDKIIIDDEEINLK